MGWIHILARLYLDIIRDIFTDRLGWFRLYIDITWAEFTDWLDCTLIYNTGWIYRLVRLHIDITWAEITEWLDCTLILHRMYSHNCNWLGCTLILPALYSQVGKKHSDVAQHYSPPTLVTHWCCTGSRQCMLMLCKAILLLQAPDIGRVPNSSSAWGRSEYSLACWACWQDVYLPSICLPGSVCFLLPNLFRSSTVECVIISESE